MVGSNHSLSITSSCVHDCLNFSICRNTYMYVFYAHAPCRFYQTPTVACMDQCIPRRVLPSCTSPNNASVLFNEVNLKPWLRLHLHHFHSVLTQGGNAWSIAATYALQFSKFLELRHHIRNLPKNTRCSYETKFVDTDMFLSLDRRYLLPQPPSQRKTYRPRINFVEATTLPRTQQSPSFIYIYVPHLSGSLHVCACLDLVGKLWNVNLEA